MIDSLIKADNWKVKLSKSDEKNINKILINVSKYREAYQEAENVKIAQLWCAILELHKENAQLYAKMKHLKNKLNSLNQIKRLDKNLNSSLDKF